jgi:hypothetical protein
MISSPLKNDYLFAIEHISGSKPFLETPATKTAARVAL